MEFNQVQKKLDKIFFSDSSSFFLNFKNSGIQNSQTREADKFLLGSEKRKRKENFPINLKQDFRMKRKRF